MHKFSKQLFWDVNPENLDFEKHKAFIVQRVLEYGLMEDWKALNKTIKKAELIEIIKNLRYLDLITMHFVSNFYKIPLDDLRCYKQKQLAGHFWDY